MEPAIVELIKAGGLMAFAAAVWWELRQQRVERNAIEAAHSAQLSTLREGVATLVEAVRGLTRQKPPTIPPDSGR